MSFTASVRGRSMGDARAVSSSKASTFGFHDIGVLLRPHTVDRHFIARLSLDDHAGIDKPISIIAGSWQNAGATAKTLRRSSPISAAATGIYRQISTRE